LTNGNFIKPTILIARQKPGEEKDLAVLLQNKNISVIRVESGSDALSVCLSNPSLSLAMIDADIPGLNGFETTLQIRKLSSTIPIVLFLNYGNLDSIRLAILVGCTRILQNPVDPAELDTIVNQYLIQTYDYSDPNS
jgi:DNA-binding NtrC family response regulator